MTVGVYGLGRFGAFWASALATRFDVKGYSRNPDRKASPPVRRVDEEEVLDCDVLFLCVAISAMETVLERISARLQPGGLVLDTCSVKVYPVSLMRSILPEHVGIIGTHPMFGPDSGKYGIEGLPMVFCPVRTHPEQERFWREAFVDMGLSVHTLSPEDHDREAAYTQGVTHFMGRVLDDIDLVESSISTMGYRKLLEIIEQTCNDPLQLFIDLQRFNPYTGEMRSRLRASLEKIQRQLDASGDA